MNNFEFIMVLASIIIGLGIAELLQTTSKMLRGIAEKGILHIFWSICTLNQLVQYFWSSWRNIQSDWTYIELLLVILPTIILYLVSTLLSISKNQNDNLDAHFIEQRVPFFSLMMILVVLFTINDYVFVEGDISRNLIRGSVFAMFCFLAYSKNRILHIAGAVILIVLQTIWIANWSFSLSEIVA